MVCQYLSPCEKNGLNLYCSFAGGIPKIRHTWFRTRPSVPDTLFALEDFIIEICNSNYQPLYDLIEVNLEKNISYSSRALLSACLFKYSPAILCQQYENIMNLKKLPKNYRIEIESVRFQIQTFFERELTNRWRLTWNAAAVVLPSAAFHTAQLKH